MRGFERERRVTNDREGPAQPHADSLSLPPGRQGGDTAPSGDRNWRTPRQGVGSRAAAIFLVACKGSSSE